MTKDTREELRELSRSLRELSGVMRALMGLTGGGAGSLVGLAGAVPGGQFLGLAAGAMDLWKSLSAQGPEVHFHQEININIGDGQISERAFWDDLVQYHLVPSLERGGLVPVPQGGAE